MFFPARNGFQPLYCLAGSVDPISSTVSLSAVTCGTGDRTTYATVEVSQKAKIEIINKGFALVMLPISGPTLDEKND